MFPSRMRGSKWQSLQSELRKKAIERGDPVPGDRTFTMANMAAQAQAASVSVPAAPRGVSSALQPASRRCDSSDPDGELRPACDPHMEAVRAALQ